MVYTKHFVVHATWKLNQLNKYIEDATKTTHDVDSPGHLNNLFEYISNDDKTISKQLVSGHHVIDVHDMAEEFIQTHIFAKNKKGNAKLLFKDNEVLAHHLIQSFSPDDTLTPEEIHEIGRKTVLELTGGQHEFVIATHVDKEHIHNHIIFNAINLETHKKFRWTKSTKKVYEHISDKHADYAGAKIIEHDKSNFKNFTDYQIYNREKSFKREIKKRVDFLLANSKDQYDFVLKSRALKLDIDFSGKYAKYKLLDEPQLRPTRSRSITKLKKYDGRYDSAGIMERLKDNIVVPDLENIKQIFDSQNQAEVNDFELNAKIEPWQIDKKTNHGIYIDMEYGTGNSGLIFIHNKFLEKNNDGTLELFVKEKDYFYFMNGQNSQFNKYLTGKTLVNQLSYFNQTIPVRKPRELRMIDDLVSALNFLSDNQVTNGEQFELLASKFDDMIAEIKSQLVTAEDKIIQLNLVLKTLSGASSDDEITKSKAKEKLQQMNIDPDTSVDLLEKQAEALVIEKNIIEDKLSEVINDLRLYENIKHTSDKERENDTVRNNEVKR